VVSVLVKYGCRRIIQVDAACKLVVVEEIPPPHYVGLIELFCKVCYNSKKITI